MEELTVEINMDRAPSGRQYELRHGDQRVVVTEVGAGLRSHTEGSLPVIGGHAVTERCTGAGGHTLLPWPNRIKAGQCNWEGAEHQLDPTGPSAGGAIHGLTRRASWTLIERGPAGAAFGHVLCACPGWPWARDCGAGCRLDDEGLSTLEPGQSHQGAGGINPHA